MTRARAYAIGRRLWPVGRVIWQERKAEIGIIMGATAIVREVVQAFGH